MDERNNERHSREGRTCSGSRPVTKKEERRTGESLRASARGIEGGIREGN